MTRSAESNQMELNCMFQGCSNLCAAIPDAITKNAGKVQK